VIKEISLEEVALYITCSSINVTCSNLFRNQDGVKKLLLHYLNLLLVNLYIISRQEFESVRERKKTIAEELYKIMGMVRWGKGGMMLVLRIRSLYIVERG